MRQYSRSGLNTKIAARTTTTRFNTNSLKSSNKWPKWLNGFRPSSKRPSSSPKNLHLPLKFLKKYLVSAARSKFRSRNKSAANPVNWPPTAQLSVAQKINVSTRKSASPKTELKLSATQAILSLRLSANEMPKPMISRIFFFKKQPWLHSLNWKQLHPPLKNLTLLLYNWGRNQ